MRILMRRRPGQAAKALLYVSDDLHELRCLFPGRLHELNIGNIINVNGYLFHVQDATDVQHIVLPRVEVKQCKRCGAIKAVTEFYTETATGKPQAVCKECRKEAIKHKQHIQAPAFKVCRVCGAEKPITAFYKQPTSPDGYCTDCKECRKVYYNEYMNRKRRIRQHERSKNSTKDFER